LLLFTALLASCSKRDSINEDQEPLSNLTPTVQENELFQLVNKHRNTLDLNNLAFDKVSYTLASSHSQYMVIKGHTSHAKFNERAAQITAETGAELVAENVANDYLTIEDVMSAWLNSPGHKKNIEGDYTHSSISIKVDASQNLYFTQIFYR